PPVLERAAEIAAQDVADPVDVLERDRPVEAPLRDDDPPVRLAQLRIDQVRLRTAGGETLEDEEERRDGPEQRERLDGPAQQVAAQALSRTSLDPPLLALVVDPEAGRVVRVEPLVQERPAEAVDEEDVGQVGREDRLDLLVDLGAPPAVELLRPLVEQLL